MEASPLREPRTRSFEPPLGREEAAKLLKRERLELVKPILRAHDEDNRERGRNRDRDPFRDARWSWIYDVLMERGPGRGDLSQARAEIEREDEHGRYWALAHVAVDLVEDGWNRWEVRVGFPRRIRKGEDDYAVGPTRRFRTRFFADRWGARQARRYERYVNRLLDADLYDDWRYEQ